MTQRVKKVLVCLFLKKIWTQATRNLDNAFLKTLEVAGDKMVDTLDGVTASVVDSLTSLTPTELEDEETQDIQLSLHYMRQCRESIGERLTKLNSLITPKHDDEQTRLLFDPVQTARDHELMGQEITVENLKEQSECMLRELDRRQYEDDFQANAHQDATGPNDDDPNGSASLQTNNEAMEIDMEKPLLRRSKPFELIDLEMDEKTHESQPQEATIASQDSTEPILNTNANEEDKNEQDPKLNDQEKSETDTLPAPKRKGRKPPMQLRQPSQRSQLVEVRPAAKGEGLRARLPRQPTRHRQRSRKSRWRRRTTRRRRPSLSST